MNVFVGPKSGEFAQGRRAQAQTKLRSRNISDNAPPSAVENAKPPVLGGSPLDHPPPPKSPPPTPAEKEGGLSPGLIGLIVGGAVLLIAVVLVLICCCACRKPPEVADFDVAHPELTPLTSPDDHGPEGGAGGGISREGDVYPGTSTPADDPTGGGSVSRGKPFDDIGSSIPGGLSDPALPDAQNAINEEYGLLPLDEARIGECVWVVPLSEKVAHLKNDGVYQVLAQWPCAAKTNNTATYFFRARLQQNLRDMHPMRRQVVLDRCRTDFAQQLSLSEGENLTVRFYHGSLIADVVVGLPNEVLPSQITKKRPRSSSPQDKRSRDMEQVAKTPPIAPPTTTGTTTPTGAPVAMIIAEAPVTEPVLVQPIMRISEGEPLLGNVAPSPAGGGGGAPDDPSSKVLEPPLVHRDEEYARELRRAIKNVDNKIPDFLWVNNTCFKTFSVIGRGGSSRVLKVQPYVGTGTGWLIRIGPVSDRFQTGVTPVSCRMHTSPCHSPSSPPCTVHVTMSCQICGVLYAQDNLDRNSCYHTESGPVLVGRNRSVDV